ncbi:MAG: hypothetical protein JOS17DRAFT_734568 [Linnemannia elongata]|nr:MAG: hypothetical protein JOS17DRAFT_734568 [Linnemannia elongata]
MLLKCFPPANLPTALSLGLTASQPTNNDTDTSAATTSDNNETEGIDTEYTSSPLDYFTHIRHLNLEPRFVEIACSPLGKLPLNSKVKEYIASKEFDIIMRSFPVASAHGQDRISTAGVVNRYISTIFQHEIPWCLASPILGQLQSLTIHHTFSLRHFIDVVDRLRSFEMVRVLFVDISNGIFSDADETVRYNRSEAAVRELVGFVCEHA